MSFVKKFAIEKRGQGEIIDREIEAIMRVTKDLYDRTQRVNINIQKEYDTTEFERFFLDIAGKYREAENMLKQWEVI